MFNDETGTTTTLSYNSWFAVSRNLSLFIVVIDAANYTPAIGFA
jgi:hypothetical protein